MIEDLQAEPAAVVMVGDTETDIQAAKNAGVASIAVSYGYSRVPVAGLGADLVIDEFTQLPGALGPARRAERLTPGCRPGGLAQQCLKAPSIGPRARSVDRRGRGR